MQALPALTAEMILVMCIMAFAVFLFITELLRVDVAAILVMLLLGMAAAVPGFETLIDREILFAGFASNAVVSIIAVMIIGRGLDKTGVMEQLALYIVRHGGRDERQAMLATSASVATLSSFMQNIGAAALFLPVIAKISAQTGHALSRLLMPMGFCAILGGTMTMVASSPLIMLNDLIASGSASLDPGQAVSPFHLFDVTPVGIALVIAGLGYFYLFGQKLLPAAGGTQVLRGASTVRYMRRIHGVDAAVREVVVPADSPLVGRDINALQIEYEVKIVATRFAGETFIEPPIETEITAPATLAVIAEPSNLRRFVVAGKLLLRPKLKDFRYLLARSIAGVAELVIPPGSKIIGESVRDLRMRKVYGATLLSIFRNGKAITEKLHEVPFQAGDTLACHIRWKDLADLESDRDFVVVTSNYPREPQSPAKLAWAVSLFLFSISLVLFTDILLPLALLVGAAGMVVTGVLNIDEAYEAVSWQTVFLLAGLLPLGHAVAESGVADYLAQAMLLTVSSPPTWMLQFMLALLATLMTLVMSNVGATVILVPIAMSTAIATGANPALFALTVAIATSNSFLLPTHQVNALILGPGKYRVADFLKVGGMMTLIFLVVEVAVLNLVF